MQFFTREWLSGGLDDAKFEATIPAYEAHLDRILPVLPGTVQALARGVNLHDGLIRSVELRTNRRTLKLALRCGDLQVGYFDVDLVYGGVDWGASNLKELASIARNVHTEVQYDEVDADATNGESRLVHRIIFAPKGEIEIVFATLGLKLVPRRGREVVRTPNVYTRDLPDSSNKALRDTPSQRS